MCRTYRETRHLGEGANPPGSEPSPPLREGNKNQKEPRRKQPWIETEGRESESLTVNVSHRSRNRTPQWGVQPVGGPTRPSVVFELGQLLAELVERLLQLADAVIGLGEVVADFVVAGLRFLRRGLR